MKRKTQLYWILAHTFAFPVALTVGFIAIHLFAFIGQFIPEIISSGLGYVLWGGIIGGLIGLIQWLFLRPHNFPARWIWNSMLGLVIAEMITVSVLLWFGIDRNIDLMLSFGAEVWTLTYFMAGALIGYLQSSFVKSFNISVLRWVVVSALVWGLSTLLWTAMIRFEILGNFAVLFGGLGFGVLSSLSLNYLLKHKTAKK